MSKLQNIKTLSNSIAQFFIGMLKLARLVKRVMTNKEAEKKEKLLLQKRFGEHLKKLRESMELTPAELARRCYMERSNIARLEAGRINPSLFVIKKLSDGLEIGIEKFMLDFK